MSGVKKANRVALTPEERKARNRANSLRWRKANPDRVREIARNSMAKVGNRNRWKRLGLDVESIPVPSDACQICGYIGKLYMDHCHETLKFRGWLCHHCNTALGMARDDTSLLARMITYLQRSTQ